LKLVHDRCRTRQRPFRRSASFAEAAIGAIMV
jgi:hypothetical protein